MVTFVFQSVFLFVNTLKTYLFFIFLNLFLVSAHQNDLKYKKK